MKKNVIVLVFVLLLAINLVSAESLNLQIIRDKMIWDLPELAGYTYGGEWHFQEGTPNYTHIDLRYINLKDNDQHSEFALNIYENTLLDSFLDTEATQHKSIYKDISLINLNGNKIYVGMEENRLLSFYFWISGNNYIRGWGSNDIGSIYDIPLFNNLTEKYLKKYPSTYRCESGNESGKCPATCVDTDNGKNYDVKGSTISGGDAIAIDNCINDIFLREQYCEDGLSKSLEYDCSSVGEICQDGRCIKQTEQCAGEGENVYDISSKGPISCCVGLVLERCEGVCTPSIFGKCVKKEEDNETKETIEFTKIYTGSYTGKKIKLYFVNYNYQDISDFYSDVNFFTSLNQENQKGFFGAEPFKTYKERFDVFQLNFLITDSLLPKIPCEIENACRFGEVILFINNTLNISDCDPSLDICDVVIVSVKTPLQSYQGPVAGNNVAFAFTDVSYEIPVFFHEFGHAFAGIADEYNSGYYQSISYPALNNFLAREMNCDLYPGCPKWCKGEPKSIIRKDLCADKITLEDCIAQTDSCVWMDNSKTGEVVDNIIQYFGSNCVPQIEDYGDIGTSCEEGTGCYFGCAGFGWRSSYTSVMRDFVNYSEYSQGGLYPYNKLQTNMIVNKILNFSEEHEIPDCNGCELNKKCYPFGLRKDGKYCSDESSFVDYKEAKESCDNNFECSSNVCVSGKCISEGLIQKILNWFRRLFGGK